MYWYKGKLITCLGFLKVMYNLYWTSMLENSRKPSDLCLLIEWKYNLVYISGSAINLRIILFVNTNSLIVVNNNHIL